MTAQLCEVQQFILKKLGNCHASSGMVNAEFTHLIGRQPGADSKQQHAAYVRGLLLDLERRGLIVRADELKPILWRLKP